MKNFVKLVTVMAAAVMVLGFGVHKANASGVDFSIGLNFGVPVATAPVYASATVYTPHPAPVYHVERVRYVDGYRPVAYRHDYRHDRFRQDRGWHRGWDGGHHGYDRY